MTAKDFVEEAEYCQKDEAEPIQTDGTHHSSREKSHLYFKKLSLFQGYSYMLKVAGGTNQMHLLYTQQKEYRVHIHLLDSSAKVTKCIPMFTYTPENF